MSSNKKKKKDGGQQRNSAPKPAPKAAENNTGAGEDNIPVQSLSEMLAFAHEAEAQLEEKEKSEEVVVKVPPANKAADDEKKNGVRSEPTKTEKVQPQKQTETVKVKSESAEAKEKPESAKKSSTEAPAKPVPESKAEQPASSGPPISAEVKAKQAAAEDALDRDLQAARRKKLQEEAYMKHRRDMEIKKEEERIERAERAKQRQINAAEAAKKLEAAKAERADEEKIDQTSKPAPNTISAAAKKKAVTKYFNRTLFSMAAGRAVALVIVILLIAYGGAHIYINSVNEALYSELETKLSGQSRLVSDSSIAYQMPEISPLTYSEKQEMGLSVGLSDSDKDGLTDDYELEVSRTDPLNPDSDGDGVTDGAELRAELDPLKASTDGVTSDSELIRDTVLADRQVTARIKGIPKTSYATLSKLDNNSIQGTPGIIGYAYEFYSEKAFDDCELVFAYTADQLANEGTDESALSIYRFNPDNLTFENVQSMLSKENKSVSAHISSNGIYALCDSSVLAQDGETNVFFLIDNSGSMYPEELCANSEENDVEFKRLDFAVNLIDMLGTDANYGAGEFSGSYANISPISSDSEAVKQKISDIRNKKQVFSGTEIAGAVTNAVSEFGTVNGSDKNYIILLTDGMPSTYNAAKEKAAIEAACKSNITIFTIGLGKYIDAEYLFNIAGETNGQFFQASNADALENIYEKIQNFMSYNQVTIEEDSGQKGYIIADSGFNVQRDGIGYSNFRSEFAPNGADVGIAGLIRAYYTGELALKASGYTTSDGKAIAGYDISAVDGFRDGKADLRNVEIQALGAYNEYTAIKDKWDYRGVTGGVLHYTSDTRDFVDNAGLRVFTTKFDFTAPEESGFVKFLRKITFNSIRDFSSYECVLLDSNTCEGSDAAVMDMLRWYCNIPNAQDKCAIYDFGYEGDTAFAALVEELTTGSPAVITYGGSAMNAVRIVRDVSNPDKFVLDAYDSNSPDRSTRINIVRTPIYSSSGTSYQYTASRGSVEEPLRIIVTE